jgi:hypothetical protein
VWLNEPETSSRRVWRSAPPSTATRTAPLGARLLNPNDVVRSWEEGQSAQTSAA